MRSFTALLVVALAGSGCASTGSGATGDAARQDTVTSRPVVDPGLLPTGTVLRVELADTLHAERTRVGDRFSVRVAEELRTLDDRVAVPAGTVITGLVTGVDDTDHAGDTAYVRLNFIRISIGGANHPFAAEILDTELRMERAGDLEDAATEAGIDAAAGVLGAIISGDLRRAVESAVLGTGAGTVVALGTDAERAQLPPGTRFTLRTTADIDLRR